MSDGSSEPLGRWKKALDRLAEVLDRNSEDRALKDAAIQRFEFGYELGWKAVKACLQVEGREWQTPREVIQEAFRIGWIADERAWLSMLSDRNLTSHTYNEALADAVYGRLRNHEKSMRELLNFLSRRYEC